MKHWKARNKWVKVAAACLAIMLLATACSSRSASVSQTDASEKNPDHVQVEVLHLNHWPVKAVLEDIKQVVAQYEGEVDLRFLAFGSTEGDALAEERKIAGHTPLVIFIDGRKDFQINGKDVSLYSFPDGSGTLMMGSGGWTMDDLDSVLAQLTGG